ncbi:WD40-repeat-containing domain protein [Elaphomyces granulatus]
MSKITVKTTFEPSRTLRPIYTGGSTSLDASGRLLATCVGEDALIVNLETGDQLVNLEGDGEVVTSLAIASSASHVVVCSRSISMRIYSLSPYDESSPIIEAKLLKTLKPHTSPVVTTVIDCTSTLLATGGADGLIKVLDIRGGYVTHTFHGHGGVISALCFFEVFAQSNETDSFNQKKKSKRKGGGSRDVKMVDDGTSETDSLSGFRLASGSEDGKVRVWDLHKRKSIAGLDSHVSVVRGLSFSPAENALLSASRDKTIIIWDVRTWKIRRIIPALESVEAAGFISDTALCFTGGEKGRLRVWNANRGNEVTQEQSPADEIEAIVAIQYSPGLPFIMTVHADQTLRLHSLGPLAEYKQGLSVEPMPVLRRISGNDDEVIDLAYVGPDRSMLAMATNTESIRVVSIGPPAVEMPEHNRYFGVDVTHLDGHEDIIICIDVDWSGHWLATGAKDNNARLWRLDPETSSYTCFAIFTGHAESIGAISLPRCSPPASTSTYHHPLNYPPAFLFTGSQDRTIKRWDSGKLKSSEPHQPHSPKALYTRKAHEKDINALDVNHTSTLFASASQDRTVKIWSAEDGSVVGVLRGHKRGVWSVRFAPRDTPIVSVDSGTSTSRGMVVTGSGDKTVKLWSLSDYSCLLTFEGHSNSVLKVLWLPPPQLSTSEDEESQTISRHAAAVRPLIASAAADGLVKIWSPYTGELEATLDNHTDRVWALATPTPSGSRVDTKMSPSPENAASQKTTRISSPYALISGSADSTVTFWTDTTSAALSAAVAANSARIEQDQQLQNYIRASAYREAITLALQLNHPGRLLSLFTAAINDADGSSCQQPTNSAPASLEDSNRSLTGNPEIDTVLQSLDRENLYTLLLRVRDWNTNARTAKVAQRILYSLVRSYPPSTFVELATDPSLTRRGSNKGSRGPGMKEVLDALAVYTDRHYRRIDELVDESYLVEWVLGEMDGGLGLSGLSNPTGFPLAGPNGASQDREKDIIML